MYDFTAYLRAQSVNQAVRLLAENPGSIPIAGGTDILVQIREGHPGLDRLVDINGLAELRRIELTPEGDLVIGSGTTFTDLLTDPLIAGHAPILVDAARDVAGPQIRNTATIGGNVCNGAPSADSAAPLLVLQAMVNLIGPEGERSVPLEDFYTGVGRVDRAPEEIMTGVTIHAEDMKNWQGTYIKYAARAAMDIATIGCAASVRFDETDPARPVDFRLAYIVAGPTPRRCRTTEDELHSAITDPDFLDRVQEKVLSDLAPRDSWRGARDFRRHLIKVLARRALAALLERPEGGRK